MLFAELICCLQLITAKYLRVGQAPGDSRLAAALPTSHALFFWLVVCLSNCLIWTFGSSLSGTASWNERPMQQQTNSQILNCELVWQCRANLKPQPNCESSLDHTVSPWSDRKCWSTKDYSSTDGYSFNLKGIMLSFLFLFSFAPSSSMITSKAFLHSYTIWRAQVWNNTLIMLSLYTILFTIICLVGNLLCSRASP